MRLWSGRRTNATRPAPGGAHLRAELADTQDQLASVREANRRIMKSANTGRTP
ncbi:hypothetical protein [Kitasatospora sp. HPMI-4]|uniref:hypothetical protein n=1 Tax=Kitasatospora sp. HPMI-4 TaxID=3448443 RepID=UPI003F19963A